MLSNKNNIACTDLENVLTFYVEFINTIICGGFCNKFESWLSYWKTADNVHYI